MLHSGLHNKILQRWLLPLFIAIAGTVICVRLVLRGTAVLGSGGMSEVFIGLLYYTLAVWSGIGVAMMATFAVVSRKDEQPLPNFIGACCLRTLIWFALPILFILVD